MHHLQQQKGDQIDVCLRIRKQGRRRRNRIFFIRGFILQRLFGG